MDRLCPYAVKRTVWGCCGLIVGCCLQSHQIPALSPSAGTVEALICRVLSLPYPIRSFCWWAALTVSADICWWDCECTDAFSYLPFSMTGVTLEWCWSLQELLGGWDVAEASLEGLLLEWGRLDGVVLQKNMGARHRVLARLVESVCAVSCKCPAIWDEEKREIILANSCSWGSLLKIHAPLAHVLGLVNKSFTYTPGDFTGASMLYLGRFVCYAVPSRAGTQFSIALQPYQSHTC